MTDEEKKKALQAARKFIHENKFTATEHGLDVMLREMERVKRDDKAKQTRIEFLESLVDRLKEKAARYDGLCH